MNSIFGRIGLQSSPMVLISLIESICVPILTNASEYFHWKNKMTKSFDKAICQAYFKIFKTFDHNVALHCQYYMCKLPIELKIVLRKLNILHTIQNSGSSLLQALLAVGIENNEFRNLCNKYQLDMNNPNTWHMDIWKHFENIIQN